MQKNRNIANMRQTKTLYPTSSTFTDVIRELCERPDFEKAISDLRSKWKIDVATEVHLDNIGKKSDLQKKLLRSKKFIGELHSLQKQFNLGEQWSLFMEEYIFIDFFVYKQSNNFSIEKRTGKESDTITGKPAYYLRIFPETTQEDILKSWPEIHEYMHGKGTKMKRQKPSRKHDRDREIFKLAKFGANIQEIQKYFKHWHNKTLTDDTINTSVSRYKKKMGIEEKIKLAYNKTGRPARLIPHWPDF